MGDKLYTKKEAVAFCNQRHAKQVAQRKAAREAKKAAAGPKEPRKRAPAAAKPKRAKKEIMSLHDAKDLYTYGRVTHDAADTKKGTAAMKKHKSLPSHFIKTMEYLNTAMRLYAHAELRESATFRQDAKTAMGFGSHYAGTVYDTGKVEKAKKPRKKKAE